MPVPRPTPSAPTVEPIDLDRLGGATEATVVERIGRPDAVREQSPGKIWVYSHNRCQVEVYLYPRVGYGTMGVLGTAILPADLSAGERDRCRRDLARRSAKAG